MTDPFVGQLAFFRVYPGTLASGTCVYNATKAARSASAACCGCTPTSARRSPRSRPATSPPRSACKSVTTGDTICDQQHPVMLEAMDFPEPVISVAIEPKTKADQEKLGLALGKLVQEDPTFRVHTDPKPARRSSPAWASCTSRSSSTG